MHFKLLYIHFYTVIRNGKIVWKHIVDIFAELEISGVATKRIHQNNKIWWLFWLLLCENDFETILVTFCYYEYGANALEAVQKIAADQKDYHKCSSCVIVS